MKYILMDIEGTTTSISFVHEILFPYSKKYLQSFVHKNKDFSPTKEIIEETKQTAREEESLELDEDGVIQKLIDWINIDRKHKALKQLQGLIWEEGYQSGELKGHVYDDVPPALKKWHEQGLKLGIYSSGSVEAQRSLFGHSLFGDLNSYFTHHFDTLVGHKRDPLSYQTILSHINEEACDVLFLSDISQELSAAQVAGMKTLQLVRLGEIPIEGHRQIHTFNDVIL
jgi:enolase-phosphatase E1